MKTSLLIASLFGLTTAAVVWFPAQHGLALPGPTITQVPPVAIIPPANPPGNKPAIPSQKPVIEAVFVLDTTGSMGGLIQAAKENIWSIATTMASAQPAPELKIGMVAYRDRGDSYVTRRMDLSADLDSIYAQLMDFQADGGGDFPESVNQALNEAVFRQPWSQNDHAYKVIFLVGDAIPQQYPDEMPTEQILAAARKQGIRVNTIQAGQTDSTRQIWQQIAQLGQGDYLQVAQSGNAVTVATPLDDKIAALSRELDATRLYFGSDADRERALAKVAAAEKMHTGSSPATQAKRAGFNASQSGGGNFLGENELVDAVAAGRVQLDKLDEAALPEPLREMDATTRQAVITEKAARRDALKQEIQALADKRQDYIAKQLKESKAETASSLDDQVFRTIKAQASDKGLEYKPGPVY